MYRSILVPLDGSTFGEHALPLALGLARRSGASLRLLHVYAPLAAVYAEGAVAIDPSLERDLKQQQVHYLHDVVRRIGEVSSVPVHPEVLEGQVVTTIRAAAVGSGVDLVVMTTHGRGALARFWLGSVADQLVRELPMPLLLLRPGEGRPNLTDEPTLRHILLPLDGSPLAEQMIEPAVALGSLSEADHTLLRVITPVAPLDYPVEGTTFSQRAQAIVAQIERLQAEARKEASDYLETVAQRLRSRGLTVQTRVVVESQPAPAILHQTTAGGIDLIALETHGRHGLPRLFLGSVADKVIRGSAVPVLVHRPVHP
ncbi:MAG: universal stress protein [Gemmataceae bacterium]|nr:universal stress protein [Gemmataceae bacterium]